MTEWLMQALNARREEIMEDVLDLLMSFVDFQAFKELMLAHKLDSGVQHMQVITSFNFPSIKWTFGCCLA